MILGDIVIDTWKKVTYDFISSKPESERYILTLNRELSIYPAGYIEKAGIKKIVLARDLAFNSEYRAAVPDPYRNVLYLSVNGSYGDHDETYLVHVIHHEIHHMMEYAVWKNMYFNWAEWNSLNPEGFSYGSGGAVHADEGPDYYSVTHPLNGFLNLYSMTGGEEDRCELAAFILSERGKPVLLKHFKRDSILRRKARFLSDFINRFAGKEFININKYME
ncbi:MAG TPA: hypothetical protein PK514_08300 [Spirochaetota bacterium]|nr:hypothetical protein [Spirochaetota bacterium]